MRHIWTKVAASLAALASGLLFAGGALATEATNSNTGADSTNNATVSIQNNTTINSSNSANISNNISVWASTGNNSADKNTGDGSVHTGNITGSVSVTNTGNENGLFDSQIDLNCTGNCSFNASNSNTGAGSSNNSSISVTNDVGITVVNEADVENNVGADLNTGGNSADKNTGDGSVYTGDIDFSVEIVNDLNKNFIGLPAPEEPLGPADITPPSILPSMPKPGEVLAAMAGLPITGSSLPSWPFLVVAIGFILRILERVLRVRLGEVV
ncbi:MAG TPA: hypothetical protein VF303_00235 [Candidatus Nanoarchaeia archaeon]